MSAEGPILLVDDDPTLTRLAGTFLQDNGYEVAIEHNGQKAVDRIIREQPRLVVLDVMLPDVDGLTICRLVRPRYFGPILMLTAMDDDIDEVAGLETGADDYLTKPVKPRVLLAHIRALLRRLEPTNDPAHADISPTVFAGNLEIDPRRRTVANNGIDIPLTTAEFNLIWLLAENLGNPISRDDLHLRTFKIAYDGLDRSIDLRISRLRRKLGDDPKNPQTIKTIRSVGYMLSP